MNNKKNIRKCCVCHEHDDKSNLVRIVMNKNGIITIDYNQKLDGRGAWVHNSKECIDKLISKKLLNSALKTNVSLEIYEELKNGQKN